MHETEVTAKRRVTLTWGAIEKEPAERVAGGDFPVVTKRKVWVTLREVGNLLEIHQALAKLLPPTSHLLPHYVNAHSYLTVYDPPSKRKLPYFVFLETETT